MFAPKLRLPKNGPVRRTHLPPLQSPHLPSRQRQPGQSDWQRGPWVKTPWPGSISEMISCKLQGSHVRLAIARTFASANSASLTLSCASSSSIFCSALVILLSASRVFCVASSRSWVIESCSSE